MFTLGLHTRALVVAAAWPSLVASAVLDTRQAASTCPGYKASNIQTNGGGTTGADLSLAGSACNSYGQDLSNLKLQVDYETPERLHVKIFDAAQEVYQIPSNVVSVPSSQELSPDKSDLQFSLVEEPFSFAVIRKSTGETLFNTSGSPLIFQSQYLGLRTALPDNANIYGLGETTDPMRLALKNYTRTLWNSDGGPVSSSINLYGAHPIYYDHRANGTHAVFLRNSNGMDIKLDQDSQGQHLEYNIIGGVFDFYFLAGPSPKAVASQYAEVIGLPAMHKYSGLGFHNCRYGYQDIYEVAEVVQNYSKAGIPLETQWSDIDYMHLRRTFSLDPDRYNLTLVRQLVDYLHSHQQSYTVMVDPAVAYQDYWPFNDGAQQGAFMKNSSGSVYQAVVWPGVAAYPDWFNPQTSKFWTETFAKFFDSKTGVDIDTLWIDMNEPSNFCDFPCTNAVEYAQSHNNPPNPPPVRIGSPRAIDGFGSDFQPKCKAQAVFNVEASTVDGEKIVVFGSGPTLGTGDLLNAPLMTSGPSSMWNVSIDVPANQEVTYQYVRKHKDGTFAFEKTNRTLSTGDCGSAPQVVNDKITSSSSDPSKPPSVKRSTTTAQGSDIEISKRDSGPMSGLPGRDLLNPKYHITNHWASTISGKTARTDLLHSNGLAMYDTHNMYGHMMGKASRDALLARRPTERPLIITRSTFAGSGTSVGHWTGDINSNWDAYRYSIRQIQEFAALYQMPMVGADTCGFRGSTNEALCARWIWIGALSPFYRSHSDLGSLPHEFYRWEKTITAARAAMDVRYRLLDYMYTAMFLQTQTGLPSITPMFFEYPSDPQTALLEYQYFYGDGLLIAPPYNDNASSVDIYLPKDQFYNFYTYEPVEGKGANITVNNIGIDWVPIYYRGGSIIPQRVESANTTTMLRTKNFNVVVAPGTDGSAQGHLYLDDGKSVDQKRTSNITFDYADGTFNMTGTFAYNMGSVVLENIILLGQPTPDGYGSDGSDNASPYATTFKVNAPFTGAFTKNIA